MAHTYELQSLVRGDTHEIFERESDEEALEHVKMQGFDGWLLLRVVGHSEPKERAVGRPSVTAELLALVRTKVSHTNDDLYRIRLAVQRGQGGEEAKAELGRLERAAELWREQLGMLEGLASSGAQHEAISTKVPVSYSKVPRKLLEQLAHSVDIDGLSSGHSQYMRESLAAVRAAMVEPELVVQPQCPRCGYTGQFGHFRECPNLRGKADGP